MLELPSIWEYTLASALSFGDSLLLDIGSLSLGQYGYALRMAMVGGFVVGGGWSGRFTLLYRTDKKGYAPLWVRSL